MNARMRIGGLVFSAAALVGLLNAEKFMPETYVDQGGTPTIGFGTTKDVKPGQKITVDRALIVALRDVEGTSATVKSCVTVPLTQNEFDAYVDFSYNVGTTAFCRSTLVKKLNAEDYDGACAELLRWNLVNGKVNNGLVNRRKQEYDLCMRRD